jgi:hypothetical protein
MHLILMQGSGPVPFTGYMLCFVPLALVVLGLITLFVLTDRDATRPYLRANPFVAKSQSRESSAPRRADPSS